MLILWIVDPLPPPPEWLSKCKLIQDNARLHLDIFEPF